MKGWRFSEEELARATIGELLLNPSLDLTNACNLNCTYCFIEEKNSLRKRRLPEELTLSESLAVLEDFALAGARTVNFVGAGEPTIDPHFRQLIEAAGALGLWTVVFTNGSAFAENDDLVNFIASQNTTVVLKFNCGSHSLQDLMVGKTGHSARRDKALRRLIAAGLAATQPTRLGLDTVAVKGNMLSLPRLHRWCRQHNIYPIIADYIPTGRTQGNSVDDALLMQKAEASTRSRLSSALQPLTGPERTTLQLKLYQSDQKMGFDHPRVSAYIGGGSCTQILGVYVDIKGRIWPCVARTRRDLGNQHVPLGNVRTGDLASEMWRTSPAMTMIRAGFDGGCPYKAPLSRTSELITLGSGVQGHATDS